MTKIAGRLGRVAVSSDGGTTFFEVAGITDMSLSAAQAELNATAHDSGQFEEFINGRKDATLDLSLLWDEDDPGQNVITEAFTSATRIDVRFRMQEKLTAVEFLAKAIVTGYSPSAPNDDIATADVTLRVSGDFSFASQV